MKRHLISYKNSDKLIDGYSDKQLEAIVEDTVDKSALYKLALRYYLNAQSGNVQTIVMDQGSYEKPIIPIPKKIVNSIGVPNHKVSMDEITSITEGLE